MQSVNVLEDRKQSFLHLSNCPLHGPGDGEWKISVELDEAAKKLVSCKEQDKTPSTAGLFV